MARYSATELNPLQEKFVLEYVKCGNQADAYIAAGYKVANRNVAASNANTLLRNPKIWAAIRKMQDDLSHEVLVSKSWVLKQLILNVQKASQAEPVLDRDGMETGDYIYQGNVVNKALELLGKEIGMFRDKVDIKHEGSVQYDHNVHIHKIDELKLPLDVRRMLLQKIDERRRQMELVPDSTPNQTVEIPSLPVQDASCQSPLPN